MMASFDFVAHGGRLVFVGLFPGDISFHDPDFHSHEMTIMSSRNATAADFRHVMSSLATGAVDVSAWITHQAPFEEAAVIFPEWLEPEAGVVKAELLL
jgi:threonine dehydrogenase-like Zn-dependent dehydrogenase